MIRYELSWKAPEGKTAKAEFHDIRVDTNGPVQCALWGDASILAALIAYDNEGMTDRVRQAAREIAVSTPVDLTVTEVNGWTFSIRDAQYAA